jgi:N-acetylneuraminic acid mutarotase
MFKYAMVILFLCFFCPGCQKEEIQPKDYPYLITEKAEVSNSGVVFHASIMNPVNIEIIRYGFVWGKIESSNGTDHAKIIYGQPVKDEYSMQINSGWILDQDYFVRAFIATNTYQIYGNVISFKSLGSLPPVLYDFTPKYGPIGTKVRISGKNFASNFQDIFVSFGDFEATIDSASETELLVTSPVITEAQKVNITVEIAKMTVESTDSFDMYFPWKRTSDFPGVSRMRPVAFAIGNKGYVGLGVGYIDFLKDFWEYDPEKDKWNQLPDFPGDGRQSSVAFVIDSKAYVCLGNSYNSITDSYTAYTETWEFDPVGNVWSRKADFPGKKRNYGVGFSINGKGYAGLGSSYYDPNSGYPRDFWEYDPLTNSWKRLADIESAYFEHLRFNIYLGFSYDIGFFQSTDSHGYMGAAKEDWYHFDIYQYQAGPDKWVNYVSYPGIGYNNVNGFAHSGKLYLGFGRDEYDYSKSDFWEFDPAISVWTQMSSCPIIMEPHASFSIGQKGYIGVGWQFNYDFYPDNDYSYVFYEFDRSKN